MPAKRKRYASYVWTDPKSGHVYARVQIPLPTGKTKTVYRRAINKTHAEQLAEEIRREFNVRGEAYITGREMTFRELADWYKETYLVAPVYSESGKKVSGLRTWEFERGKVERLAAYFSKIKTADITERTLHDYKKHLETQNLKAATVNRYFETLRVMFAKAKRRRWLPESPFEFGEQLIVKAHESRRTVTLTDEQETLLLENAQKLRRTRIYYLLLVLRDTGARPSEIYPVNEKKDTGVAYEPVRWRDFFDHDFKAVRLTSYKGKQVAEQFAPVTDRVEKALLKLWYSLPDAERQPDALVFPNKSYKTAWKTVLEMSNLTDIRLRDMRRDFRTRLAKLGFSDSLTQKLLGHKSYDTSFYYLEADKEAVTQAKNLLDKSNETALESKEVN